MAKEIADLKAQLSAKESKKGKTGLTVSSQRKISKTTKALESIMVSEYSGWLTLKQFGFKTGIKATPVDKKTNMRDIYISKKFENTADGWDNFMAEVEAMKDNLQSIGGLYR